MAEPGLMQSQGQGQRLVSAATLWGEDVTLFVVAPASRGSRPNSKAHQPVDLCLSGARSAEGGLALKAFPEVPISATYFLT